jgi:putative endonuclease
MDMWFAYALRSNKDGHLYIGMTADLDRRVAEHNRSYNQSTKSRGPFQVIYVEKCGSRGEAREREKYLKSGTGREFLKRINQGGGNSTVESHSSKVMVAGSNPVPRSRVWK